jgi:RTX calcium-binding nonapeptide repeat (4 copies)
MKRFGVLLAVVALLIPTGVVSADSTAISFEPSEGYSPGSIQGQDGWAGQGGTVAINPAIDQRIVTNGAGAPASFGTQSWRFSNAYTDGMFATWPFSPSLNDEAGEFEAASDGFADGVRQTHFEVQWSFASFTGTPQPGLQVSTAPDRGDGARMSYIRMGDDNTVGMYVAFVDYERGSVEPAGTCVTGANFKEYRVASGLSRTVPHTVKLAMDFVDGPANDVVKVYVDGTLRRIGTSWEDYFRDCERNPTRPVDSMIFQARTASGDAPLTLGAGFLIDNLSYASSKPTTCNVIIGTDGPDTLTGTNKNDCIDGRGGDDTIYGGNGQDVLLGGDGNDTIYGGNGADYVSGGNGDDTLYGNNAGDEINSSDGNIDTVDGGNGRDTCIGDVIDLFTDCE